VSIWLLSGLTVLSILSFIALQPNTLYKRTQSDMDRYSNHHQQQIARNDAPENFLLDERSSDLSEKQGLLNNDESSDLNDSANLNDAENDKIEKSNSTGLISHQKENSSVSADNLEKNDTLFAVEKDHDNVKVDMLKDCGGLDTDSSIEVVDCIKRIRPLPLVLKNRVQIPDHTPSYNPEVEKPESDIYVHREMNEMIHSKSVPILNAWLDMDVMTKTKLACEESSTLCEAIDARNQWKKNQLRFISGSKIPALSRILIMGTLLNHISIEVSIAIDQ
jgi:hypothetical protein